MQAGQASLSGLFFIKISEFMYRRVIHRRYRKKRFIYLFLVLIILIALGSLLTMHKFDFFHHDREFDEIIRLAAKRHGLDPCLVKAVVWKESRFKQNTVGSHGEIGLMQIMDGAVKDWADANRMPIPCDGILFEPEVNIEIGAWYLGRALKYWKKKGYSRFEELALCEYNAGRKRTKTWLPPRKTASIRERIAFPSTRYYVTAIMDKYLDYSSRRQAE